MRITSQIEAIDRINNDKTMSNEEGNSWLAAAAEWFDALSTARRIK